MEKIAEINGIVNGFVWGWPIIILILGTGFFYTWKLGFLQFRNFGYLLRATVVKAFKKDPEDQKAAGDISSFQAAMISISAIVGSGNIAGVATAIVMGGPGALFWMVAAAFLGMASKFAEITLGIKYREVKEDGSIAGGAMYYLSNGLHQKWLGILFSIFVICTYFVIACVVDTNTIALAMQNKFGIDTMITGVILAAATAVVVFGGGKRIGHVCEVLSPFMAGAYILGGLAIILLHIGQVPAALGQIIEGAFSPAGITGGAVGSFFVVLRYGMARGMFSNEAGMGTAAMVHSGAKVKHPCEQAVWGPVEVFLDTVLVCSISGLAITLSGLWSDGALDGAALTMAAFDKMLPGNWGSFICLGAVILFGYSCLISCYIYAERASGYIFGTKSKYVVRVLWIGMILVGAKTTLGMAWDLADTCNGLMIIPNLIGILLLSKEVLKLKREYTDPDILRDREARKAKKAGKSA